MVKSSGELIVDFPTQRVRSRSIHFAERSEMKYVKRLTDYDEGIHRHELWYSELEYGLMKRANWDAVHAIRAKSLAGVPVSYGGNDGGSDDECLVGIEHLLTQGCINAVRTCRERCVHAVLAEQSIQASIPSRWSASNIALASYGQTGDAAIRARKLGQLHRKAI